MATFPSITPTYGIQKRSAPNIRKVQFGDGYNRFTLGLNQDPKVYNLTFEVSRLIPTRSNFLDARAADFASFDYATRRGGNSKFVCGREQIDSLPDRATIQATFRQVFEP